MACMACLHKRGKAIDTVLLEMVRRRSAGSVCWHAEDTIPMNLPYRSYCYWFTYYVVTSELLKPGLHSEKDMLPTH
jgi:hypothetical protein